MYEIPYIVKGLTAQLIKRVSRTGLVFCPALSTSAKSIFTMMGYIIKKRQTATGMETTGAPPTDNVKPSRYETSPGAVLPKTIPAAIHRMTQTVRYRSNALSPFGVGGFDGGDIVDVLHLLEFIVDSRFHYRSFHVRCKGFTFGVAGTEYLYLLHHFIPYIFRFRF